MTDSELIEHLSKELKIKNQLEHILGEVLATLRLNFAKGHLLSCSDDGTQRLNSMIVSWEEQLKKIISGKDTSDYDKLHNVLHALGVHHEKVDGMISNTVFDHALQVSDANCGINFEFDIQGKFQGIRGVH